MSKRSSKNTMKYGGKVWGAGKAKRVGKKRIENQQKKENLKVIFSEVCSKLNFKLSAENFNKYRTYENLFLDIQRDKERKMFTKNVNYYIKQCRETNKRPSIDEYIKKKLFLKDYNSK